MPGPDPLAAEVEAALGGGATGLTRAAILLGRLESPGLAIDPTLRVLENIGRRALARAGETDGSVQARTAAIGVAMYREAGFRGNREHYDDARNSLLHVVVERRLGIPISLAVVYMAIGHAAGVPVQGITFPGHFLLRVAGRGADGDETLVLDPFDAGAVLDARAVRELFMRHTGDRGVFEESLLEPCTDRQIIVRMLNNLKRLYVASRSFPQAWRVTDLLVAIDRGQPEDIRDRGLLAYHLDDFQSALRDLEAYLAAEEGAHEDTAERRQIWEHVSALRRRVAALN